MIDVDLKLTVTDGTRRFDLAARFATDVPFAALYGPSGAGKTLTLQAIAGLLHPSAGHVRLDGRTLYDSARGIDVPAPARRIGYLFQNYALFPHLSVRENVAFGLTAWHRRRLPPREAERVQALLEGFGLAALADSRPQKLSGGQQQRVALARALACEPQVLLLDEPFAALNPMLRSELRHELAQVRRQWGIPVLMITHDIEDVLALADVAFVYSDGQVVREIDLHNAQSRAFALREAGGVPAAEASPLHRKLRGLLLQDATGRG
ncbi:ABC transporter ATP-binding protein [Variovorax paradoxus]|jgi:molybdate transport system ATP-binding protein|uniref:ABC transporter ATP-binding protein n=1 Tax=Variovorax paradoxus TaxID=34073 RepID=UPI0029C876A5|nr:ATP-binding cassette domain-containing protein [Variovorax paradoxus]WPH19473.1 ATP-binding cassette domain-containing protein [Variovorax paradoxus]